MFIPTTKNGHSMYDMASLLQKSIRRADFNHAGYAVNELYWNFGNYLWKRLLVISAEDCYGIVTKEIVALKIADDIANKGRKEFDKDPIFVAKAATLLCQSKKNRDACYLACNYICVDRLLESEEIKEIKIDESKLGEEGIPDWVFDIHTLKGKRAGKTDLDMTIDEQAALNPLQLSFFDNSDWKPYYQNEKAKGNFKQKEWFDIEAFIARKQKEKLQAIAELLQNGKNTLALYLAYDNEIGTKEENQAMKTAYDIARSKAVLSVDKTCLDDEYEKGLKILVDLVM